MFWISGDVSSGFQSQSGTCTGLFDELTAHVDVPGANEANIIKKIKCAQKG